MEMNFDKNIFSQAQALFTQEEFNKALGEAKAEIMAIAIQTTKQAMFLERRACAQMLLDMADMEDEGAVCTALRNAAEHMVNRIPSQNQ
jgi:putative heme iron utilization protein